MASKKPKYKFKIKQIVEIQKVRHVFVKSFPSSDNPNDYRPEPTYLFHREWDECASPLSESEVAQLYFDRQLMALSEGKAKSKTVPIGPDGPKDKKWAPVRKFWCERYDENPVPHSERALKGFRQKVLDEWGKRPEFPKLVPAFWTVRGWVKERGVPGDRPMCAMDRRDPKSRQSSEKLRAKILAWAVAWFYSYRPRDRKDAAAKIIRITSFLNRRRLKKNPAAEEITIPHYSTICRHITKAESKKSWGAKNNEKQAYRRFAGVQQGLTATRLLERIVIDGTPADQQLALIIDDDTLEPVGRATVEFSVDIKTRCLLGVTPSYEPPSLFTAMTILKRTVLPKIDLIAARPDLADTLEPHGKPGGIVFDRGWEHVGPTNMDALEDAQIDPTFADSGDPEYKGIGERAIGTFTRKFFHKAPGGIPYPPYLLRKMGIDPTATLVHTMSQFEERILDAVDDYNRQEHSSLNKLSPIEMWRRESQIHGIETLDDPDFLDAAFAEVFDVSITRQGVFLEGVRYHDDLGTGLLMERLAPLTAGHGRRGTTIRARAKAKRNPADQMVLHVWNWRDQEYVRLPAQNAHYLLGLNRQQKILYKTFAENEGIPFNTDEDKAKARLRLVEKLERDLPGLSIQLKRSQRQLLSPTTQSVIGTSVRVQTVKPSPSGMNDLQVPTSYGRRAGDGMAVKANRPGGKRATAKAMKTRKEKSWARKAAEAALERTKTMGGPARGFAPNTNGSTASSATKRPEDGFKTAAAAFPKTKDVFEFVGKLKEKGWGGGSTGITKKQNGKL